MASDDIDLLAIERGLVVAPAGCGKTQLIVKAMKRHTANKPILILTHTNAGVAALRNRLDCAKVQPSRYRVSTIDGFAIRLVGMFPGLSELDVGQLKAERPPYKRIREAACKILAQDRIDELIRATYVRLFVDEYQDCSQWQHAVVFNLSRVLPTCVLGDQLQAIFDFGDDSLADWNGQVGSHFPVVAELKIPWRWINAGARELGHWVLAARKALLAGQKIDLRNVPSAVDWVQLDGTSADRPKQLKASNTKPHTANGQVLIIGDSMSPLSQQRLARQIPDAVVIESVDLRDLVSFASRLDLASPDAIKEVASFASTLMTATSADQLIQRLETIKAGRARRGISSLEQAALDFCTAPTYRRVAELLAEFNSQPGVHVYRRAVLRACLRSLNECDAGAITFRDAAVRAREHYRMGGRVLPRRGVGSTLLLKGLEAEVCVVVEGDKLNAKNLYVAVTRGSNRLVICSRNPVLPTG